MKTLKTIRANSMPEALAEVKRSIGDDAVILHTRTVRRGGLWGIGAKPCVEVTAADAGDVGANGAPAKRPGSAGSTHGALTEELPRRRGLAGTGGDDSPGSIGTDDSLRSEIADLRSLVGDLVRQTRRAQHATVPEELLDFYQQLLENEVAQEMAGEILGQVRQRLSTEQLLDADTVRIALQEQIEALIPAIGGIELTDGDRPTVVALVGPTGVGKTTTIAKLAAEYALRRGRRVGLITVDTYRIAAVQQLQVYAEIINVPLQVVLSPEEMADALASLRTCDLVLIDTAGRSQTDEVKLRQLHCFLAEARPDEVHLVLSATTRPHVADRITQAFESLGVNRVIFTKLDEAVGLGVVLRCMSKLNARLSYVTTGQNVPDEIEPGSARLIARQLLRCQDRTVENRS